jgi:hypothetical protein
MNFSILTKREIILKTTHSKLYNGTGALAPTK